MNAVQWRVVAASVTGAGHAGTSCGCQDAHHWTEIAGGILVAAVADGAGTASLGAVGASVAAKIAVTTIKRDLEAGGWPGQENESRWRDLQLDAFREALV
jgi:serine/threonine protein phosphatase PrpC